MVGHDRATGLTGITVPSSRNRTGAGGLLSYGTCRDCPRHQARNEEGPPFGAGGLRRTWTSHGGVSQHRRRRFTGDSTRDACARNPHAPHSGLPPLRRGTSVDARSAHLTGPPPRTCGPSSGPCPAFPAAPRPVCALPVRAVPTRLPVRVKQPRLTSEDRAVIEFFRSWNALMDARDAEERAKWPLKRPRPGQVADPT